MQNRTELRPVIIPRSQHSISRRNIDPDALKVLYRLHHRGYKAYLVGGSVRDLLLGRSPKDFDVSTDAHPSKIKKLFRNCRIIGRRFRIAHIYFKGNKIIEVSTFRRNMDGLEWTPDEKAITPARDESIFGEPYEDAFRRDLTINGLFYDIATFSVVDYVGGIADLRDGIVRAIGNPDKKFHEDPVRMIRAIRHAVRTGFVIEQNTYDSIIEYSHLISSCNRARLLDEFQKDLTSGQVRRSIELLQETGLLKGYFADLSLYLERPSAPSEASYSPEWVWSALEQLDQFKDRTSLPMILFYLPFVFPLLEQRILSLAALSSYDRQAHSESEVVHSQLRELTMPLGISKKDVERLTMIWMAIGRLEKSMQRRCIPLSFQKKPYFQCLIDAYRLKWVAAGSPLREVDENIRSGISGGKRMSQKYWKRRRVRQ